MEKWKKKKLHWFLTLTFIYEPKSFIFLSCQLQFVLQETSQFNSSQEEKERLKKERFVFFQKGDGHR